MTRYDKLMQIKLEETDQVVETKQVQIFTATTDMIWQQIKSDNCGNTVETNYENNLAPNRRKQEDGQMQKCYRHIKMR